MNTTTPDKTPSNELASLIKETVEAYFTAREIWSRVLEKGKQERFTEKELQDIALPLLNDRLTRYQIKYLFHRDGMQMASKKQSDNTQAVDYPLSVEFYKELDAMAELEKESKEEGFSKEEIEILIRQHLKDSVPKDMLDDWLKSIS